MKVLFLSMVLFLSLFTLVSTTVRAQSPSVCPTSAVFLVLPDQVRGYSTRSNGLTTPCQTIQGSATTLSTGNAVSISKNGYLHVLQFLTDGAIAIFPPDAHGNLAPLRIERTNTNDLLALATDTRLIDFTLSRRHGSADIIVNLSGQTNASYGNTAQDFTQGSSVAIDIGNNLVIAGYDRAYNGLIETFDTSGSSPALVRTLGGALTGLYPGGADNFISNTLSLAVDPVSGELYVYNYSEASGARQISVFAAGSEGNVAPTRVLAGPLTGIGAPGQLNSKIAVSADGRLFVAEAKNRILVFAPGARGDVAPAQVIEDSNPGSASAPQGGIGVRSCSCR